MQKSPEHLHQGVVESTPLAKQAHHIGCFAAGTLVHTANGLVPIEHIRVGTYVLSQPENGGEQALRRVLNKTAHLDQPVMIDFLSPRPFTHAAHSHPFQAQRRRIK